MQKLIKLNPEHYIIVDDSKINNGDVHFDFDKNEIDIWEGNLHSNRFKCKKITHSTQPLDTIILKNRDHSQSVGHYYGDGGQLSLQEVKELIGEVDMEKNLLLEIDDLLAHLEDFTHGKDGDDITEMRYKINQALEDNKEKKYTEEDLITFGIRVTSEAFSIIDGKGYVDMKKFDKILQSFQPKTSWEVEIVDGKLKLI